MILAPWLNGMSRDTFLREHFQRAPLAQPSTARDAVSLLTWGTVARLVQSKPDTLIVRNAKLRAEPVPASIDGVVELFQEGYSIVMRRCERHEAQLAQLAAAVGEELEGDVSIQTYITPKGFQSFGWHYDCEDVFILQTGGMKEYFLRQNTVNPEPRLAAMPRDMHYERETTPISAATLTAGDCLYIPRGWWHAAKAHEDSLSISIGVLSPAAAG